MYALTGCRDYHGKAVSIELQPISAGLAQEQVDAHEAVHRETIDSMGCEAMWRWRWRDPKSYARHILYDEVKAYCYGSLPVVMQYRPEDSTMAVNFFAWLIAKKGFRSNAVWKAWNEKCPTKLYPGGTL